MNKKILLIIILIAISIVAFFYKDKLPINLNINSPKEEAWNTLEKYIGFAKDHDLLGLKSVSHQTSAICLDESKEKECFELMDSVVLFTENFKASDFSNIKSDDKQIILYTEGPEVILLYFTIIEDEPKLLGIRLCTDMENATDTCEAGNVNINDSDGDGWWDSTESLFYK